MTIVEEVRQGSPKKGKGKRKQLKDSNSFDRKKKISIDVGEATMSTTHMSCNQKQKKHTSNNTKSVSVVDQQASIPPKKKRKHLHEQADDDFKEETASGDADTTPDAANERPPRKGRNKRASDGGLDTTGLSADYSSVPPPSDTVTDHKSKKNENLAKQKDPQLEGRTVFVGNLPLAVNKRSVRKLFAQYGGVVSVRLRSAPRLDARKPIRMSVITSRFSKERSSINGYVRFKTVADAERAASGANGVLFHEHHLRVDLAVSEVRHDPNKAVFVGGLPLNTEDNHLWQAFSECGSIVSVRVVRDAQSMIGKGFGYVNFADEKAAHRALKLNGSELEGRTIRVQKCHATARAKVDRVTGKKLRREKSEGATAAPAVQPPAKLAPLNVFSGDAVAESRSSIKKKKKKKERWDDAKRQKRDIAQSLRKTIAPSVTSNNKVTMPAHVVSFNNQLPQNKIIKFEVDDVSAEKNSEKLKEIRLKKEAKRKKKFKDNRAKKKKCIVEPLTNVLPSLK